MPREGRDEKERISTRMDRINHFHICLLLICLPSQFSRPLRDSLNSPPCALQIALLGWVRNTHCLLGNSQLEP